jgi:serine/threonine-protein kinase
VDERDAIDKLARAVAERSPVTWEDELRSVPGDESRDVVEQLRVVDRIFEAHWGPSGTPTRLGDFEVIRELGRGAMGRVYEARQVSLDRRVAVKVLAPEMTGDPVRLRRFEREAKSLASLNHPNIVTIHSVESIEGTHFIGMELIEGQDLALMIRKGGLPIEKLLDVAIPMADALSSAHEHHIIHRDLKPANVMINNEGRVKILDFGLAKLRGESGISDQTAVSTVDIDMTREGFVVGTVPYMSPEQAEGREIDHRSDLFSFGTVLYEMATGERPFEGQSQSEIVSSIANETPLPAVRRRPDIPEELDRIIGHCLRKDPERRYQTAKGLRNELEELKTRRELDKLPPPPVPKWPLWAAISTAAVLLIALLFGGKIVEIIKRLIDPTPPASSRYLVVLPFDIVGEDSEEIIALNAGLTDVLAAKLTELTSTHDLQIASRVRRTPPLTVETVGKELGVNLALAGILQRSGSDVRVTVNLVDVRDQTLLGAEVVSGVHGDPFALQDQIVVAAVDMLDLELPAVEQEGLRAYGTTVASAYELYLQGRGHLTNYDDPENVGKAIAAFDQALARDNDYAQAHAGLGMAYWKQYELDNDTRWVDRASQACGQAVELDDELASAHACLGTVYNGTGKYGMAMTEFGWAISQDPTNDRAYRGLAEVFESLNRPDSAEEVYRKAVDERPHYWATHNWLGAFLFREGRVEEAEESLEQVIKLAPDSYRGYQNLGGVFLFQGKYDEAISVLERSVELRPTARNVSNLATAYFGRKQFGESARYNEMAIELNPNDYAVWGNLGDAYYWMPGGRERSREPYRKAVELAEERLTVNPEAPEILGELGKYHAMLGNREEAIACVVRAEKMAHSNPDIEFNAAIVYAQFGEPQIALDWLERSVENGMQASWIRDNPVFDRLRGEARFEQLIR